MFSWLRIPAKPLKTPETAARPTPEPDATLEARRKALGVEDALKDIPGVTAPMLVALGENGIRTLEELAGCAVDDLYGWTEPAGDTFTTHAGVLAGFDLSREECGAMIIKARVKAGWIEDAQPPAT